MEQQTQSMAPIAGHIRINAQDSLGIRARNAQ
jgi:hypothetical protein